MLKDRPEYLRHGERDSNVEVISGRMASGPPAMLPWNVVHNSCKISICRCDTRALLHWRRVIPAPRAMVLQLMIFRKLFRTLRDVPG